MSKNCKTKESLYVQKDNKIVRYKVFSLQILVGMLKFDYYLLCKIQGAIYGDMLK
jgi:hypothetical protein